MAEKGIALPVTGTPSALMDGPLGNCLIGYDGYMCGKTTEDTNVVPDNDVKDIIYSQDGTKPADHVLTGQFLMLDAVFAEIKTSIVAKMTFGITSQATSGTPDSMTFGRFIYKSLRDNQAKVLRVYATDGDGTPSVDDQDVINYYKAVPIVQDNLINWGADTQRNLSVQFMVYYETFDGTDYSQVTGGPTGAFGYMGSASQEKVPAASWPVLDDVPVLKSAVVGSATTMTLTFAESVSEQTGASATSIVAWVDGEAIVAASLPALDGATQEITFDAASFAAGESIKVTIGDSVFEDATSAESFNGAVNFSVTNNL